MLRGSGIARGLKGDAGSAGAAGVNGATGPQGATGATGAAAPTNGRLSLVGNVTVGETLLVSLSLGMKRMTLPLSGVLTTDKLIAIPNGIATTGCEVQNAYPASANNVSIGYFVPALGIAATYSIPVSIYRVTP